MDSIKERAGTAIGTGATNTATIMANPCIYTFMVAPWADEYELNGYTDWFLPSKDELNQLYLQKNVVGSFANAAYWSSSELNKDSA